MNKVWLITGCSTGLGRSLAEHCIALGYKVAVTARKTSDIADIIANKSNAIGLQLDVTKNNEIKAAVEATTKAFGRIDVLVNNAGIGYFGAVEESEDDEIRRMFEINVFGLGQMTQAVLPTMRKQKSGHILNIASIAGLVGFPGVGYYNATKFAVDGLSEALAKEVAPLGIKVTIIAPSGFRTDWAGRSANNSKIQIADYAETAEQNKTNIRTSSGNQPGDPKKAAEAMVKVVESENPPLRLLLGNGAVKGARIKMEVLRKDLEEWEEVSVGADSPKQ